MRIKIKIKVILDILLFLSGIISMVTGISLLVLPSGPGAGGGLVGSASSLLDVTSRSGLRLLHDWSSIIIIALIFFHLILNWRTVRAYIKNAFRPARQEL